MREIVYFVRVLLDYHDNYMFHYFLDKTRAERLYRELQADLPAHADDFMRKEIQLIEWEQPK